ncbi:MAG TPA: hypothetical protein VNU68_29005 [Verrucomicrobiae bacterium]|nr:hypothetical protein [Verrucomicrobiae bacterium]
MKTRANSVRAADSDWAFDEVAFRLELAQRDDICRTADIQNFKRHRMVADVLLSFTNQWAYNQSGLEPDPSWSTNTFSDQDWPRGLGFLGHEPDTPGPYLVHAPILTDLTVSPAVTSYYFRTTFQFSGSTASANKGLA